MSDPRLERARALMRETEEKKNGTNRSFGDNASFPFWNIPENTTALVRILPDKDENNPWFWSEKQTINLSFNGIVGGDVASDKPLVVKVPCVDMFGDTCPVIAETKPWWKDESQVEKARKYWKKKSYIAQGFVVTSPFEEQNLPANPIRRFVFGNELVEKLKAGMADPEMEYFPTDYMNGSDFKIRKTKKGEYNNYSTSEWSRRSRPLTQDELSAIEQYGLFNLADFRGPRPDADGIAAIKAMFHASLNNEPYDFAAFGKYFKPYGIGNGDTTAAGPSLDDDTPGETVAAKPAETSKEKSSGSKPADVLATLRARTAARTS